MEVRVLCKQGCRLRARRWRAGLWRRWVKRGGEEGEGEGGSCCSLIRRRIVVIRAFASSSILNYDGAVMSFSPRPHLK